jgi:peptidoglycan/xylan/chitin deacetylase (PgdA/CDA1 family)
MTFGPHTVSHPILSRTIDEQCSREITDSWNQLRGKVLRPVPIFCYPNGQLQDFGSREIEVLRRAGLKGAVVGYGGYTESGSLARSPDAAFKICRFGYPDAFTDLVQIAGGVLRFREIVGGAG